MCESLHFWVQNIGLIFRRSVTTSEQTDEKLEHNQNTGYILNF